MIIRPDSTIDHDQAHRRPFQPASDAVVARCWGCRVARPRHREVGDVDDRGVGELPIVDNEGSNFLCRDEREQQLDNILIPNHHSKPKLDGGETLGRWVQVAPS